MAHPQHAQPVLAGCSSSQLNGGGTSVTDKKTHRIVVVALACWVLGSCSGAQAPRPSTKGQPDRQPALSPADFEPPFSEIYLNRAFVRAAGVLSVAVHRDALTSEGLSRDIEVKTFEYGDDGQLLELTELLRGELFETTRYEYEQGRLRRRVTERPGETPHDASFSYDGAGRLVRETRGDETRSLTYDADGRVARVVHGAGHEALVERTTYDSDGRTRERIQETGAGKRLGTRTYVYDDLGHAIRWTTRGHRDEDDVYEFEYTARGDLKTLLFVEGTRKIYRRSYAYDDRGFVTQQRMDSFVPAMGEGDVYRYEYTLRGGVTLYRQPPVEKPKRGRSNQELLDAVLGAFPEAYAELATVQYQTGGDGNFVPDQVTVFIPEAEIKDLSREELKRRACQVRKNLGDSCDCEEVTLKPAEDYAWQAWPDKRVVPTTVHLFYGC